MSFGIFVGQVILAHQGKYRKAMGCVGPMLQFSETTDSGSSLSLMSSLAITLLLWIVRVIYSSCPRLSLPPH